MSIHTVDLSRLSSSLSSYGSTIFKIPFHDSHLLLSVANPLGVAGILWPLAISLPLHLLDHPPTPLRNKRVLCLGAGLGLEGLALAAFAGADVTLTDLPAVLPNIRRNVRLNADVLARPGAGSVAVEALAWGPEGFCESKLCEEDLEGRPYDVVLGCELVYDDALHDVLRWTLRRVTGRGTRLYIAMEERNFECLQFVRELALEPQPHGYRVREVEFERFGVEDAHMFEVRRLEEGEEQEDPVF